MLIIKKSRIRTLDPYLEEIKRAKRFTIGISTPSIESRIIC